MGLILTSPSKTLRLNSLFSDGAIAYLLYDAFTTDRAAGAVNGTTSESPVGTGGGVVRTVTDGNSKLSIAAGVLTFATGGVGAGDPGLWYALLTRTLGRVLIASVTPGSTAPRVALGWDTAQSGIINDSILLTTSSVIQATNGGTSVSVGVFVSGTAYTLAVVQRAAGMWFFVRGGAFTNWTLLWSNTVGSGNPYPAINANSGTTTVATADNIRIPVFVYIPNPLAYDTFTRADGALGSTETTGSDGQAISARAYTLQDGTIAIVSNKASLSVVGVSLSSFATVSLSSADISIAVDIARTLGNGGVVLRWQDANNYVRAYTDGTNAKLDKIVAGVTTNVISGAVTYGAGNTVRVICSGTEFRLFYNQLVVGALGTIADASLQSGLLCGLYGSDLSVTWDNLMVWPRGTSNEYAGLDAY